MYGSVQQQSLNQDEENPLSTSFRSLSEATTELMSSILDFSFREEHEEGSEELEEDYSVQTTDNKSKSQNNKEQFEAVRRSLSFTDQDMTSIVHERDSFRELQKALRNKGCVTNTYLQQNMHHYVYHLKQYQACQQEQEQQQQVAKSKLTRSQTLPTKDPAPASKLYGS